MKNLWLVMLLVVVAACGSYNLGAPPPPSPAPPMGSDVTATEKDQAVTMHVGQKLELVLHAARGMKPWTHPTSSDHAILAPTVDPAATAVRGVTLATFQAKAAGQVDVAANAVPDCAPNQPCAQLIAVYNLKVTITN